MTDLKLERNRRSTYTALTSFILMLVNGVLGLLMTQQIINILGSDANGVSATANQFISILFLLEGGLAISINYYLFKPLVNSDYKSINSILSATKTIFNKVAIIFMLLGITLSIIYSLIVKTNLPFYTVFLIFIFSILSASFNLSFSIKYRVILQADNKEFIINIVSIILSIVFMTTSIITIKYIPNIIYVRFLVFISAILNYSIIGLIVIKKYKYISFHEIPDYSFKNESRHAVYQNITGAIYSSYPIIYISAAVSTIFTSLFVVYNNVFIIIKGAVLSIANAPRMALGQIIAEENLDKTRDYFFKYEFIVINLMIVVLIPSALLIIPFIELFTKGFGGLNYVNFDIAKMFLLISFFEILHIPSGNLLNMSGNFKVAKYFQIFATIILISGIFIMHIIFGFIGILYALLLTSIVLCVLEISYVYFVYLKINVLKFLLKFGLLISIFSILVLSIDKISLTITSYKDFILQGFFITTFSIVTVTLINLLINTRVILNILQNK